MGPEPLTLDRALDLAKTLVDRGYALSLGVDYDYPDRGIAIGDDRGERRTDCVVRVTGHDTRSKLTDVQMKELMDLAAAANATAEMDTFLGGIRII